MTDFERVLGAALRVGRGERVPGLTLDSIVEPGMCAQAARQTTEAGLGLTPGAWGVAAGATTAKAKRGGSVRWALDYAAAARAAGLGMEKAVPGCLLYWDYSWRDPATGKVYPFGHIGISLGRVPGVNGEAFLENTNAAHRPGALRPFGTVNGRLSHVFVTPVSVMGKPDLIFAPTAEALDSLRGNPEPLPSGKAAQVFLSRNGEPWADVAGKRVEFAGNVKGLIVNATNPLKVYVRTTEES